MTTGFVIAQNELRIKINKDCGLSAYAVYISILSFRNTKTNLCFPSKKLIAEECSCSEENVKKIIKKLSVCGYITIRSGSKGKANEYHFPFENESNEMDKVSSDDNITDIGDMTTKAKTDYIVEKNKSKSEAKTKIITVNNATNVTEQDIDLSYQDKLTEFLKYHYNLQSIPKSFWDKVNEKDISLKHIYDMWKQSLTELLKINDGNQRKGNEFNNFQRLYYDLTILVNKHDEYLANLAKHEHVSNSEFRNDISTALTDNAVYKNIVSNPVVTVTDELNNLDEWI